MRDGFSFQGAGRVHRLDVAVTKTGKEIVTVVVSVEGKYPQLVPVKVFGDTEDAARKLRVGDHVTVNGRLGGRDWQGRIFGDIVGETIVVDGAAAVPEPIDDDNVPF